MSQIPICNQGSTSADYNTEKIKKTTKYLARHTSLGAWIPTQTDEQKQWMKFAKQYVFDRGPHSVLEELSYAHTSTDVHLLPYLSKAALDALEQPLPVSVPKLLPSPLLAETDLLSLSSFVDSPMLRTGSTSLDKLLGGGFPADTPAIFEVSGAASAGKTQFVAQVALMCGAPVSNGGLSSFAIYTSTEGVPPVQRLQSLSTSLMQRLGLESREGPLSKYVVIENVRTSDHLLNWATLRLPYLLRQTSARLVIVDSVAAVYRAEFTDAVVRANHFVQLTCAIRRAITPMSAFCICVNQVSQAMDPFTGALDVTVPALGASWAHLMATRVFFKRTTGDRRVARILHSSYLPHDGRTEYFCVTGDGVVPTDD